MSLGSSKQSIVRKECLHTTLRLPSFVLDCVGIAELQRVDTHTHTHAVACALHHFKPLHSFSCIQTYFLFYEHTHVCACAAAPCLQCSATLVRTFSCRQVPGSVVGWLHWWRANSNPVTRDPLSSCVAGKMSEVSHRALFSHPTLASLPSM